jgi:hypothetical protein
VDHKEQHHEHHRKEREHEKKLRAEHEHQEERQPRSLHPGWYLVAAVVLVLVAVMIWTVFVRL